MKEITKTCKVCSAEVYPTDENIIGAQEFLDNDGLILFNCSFCPNTLTMRESRYYQYKPNAKKYKYGERVKK